MKYRNVKLWRMLSRSLSICWLELLWHTRSCAKMSITTVEQAHWTELIIAVRFMQAWWLEASSSPEVSTIVTNPPNNY
ncbi:hypothetical protein BJ741DRAFT_624817 [Chytriomyces cf. hyalinus JEL632]|nr:hypothetical protein BJ741DRAFT_624817 [Chytriomyces cf. hyalinus JEL632]